MIKHKTFIDELKAKAKVLSQGEAVILLDEINRREGFQATIDFVSDNLPALKDSFINNTVNLNGCRNINSVLINMLIAHFQSVYLKSFIPTANNKTTIKGYNYTVYLKHKVKVYLTIYFYFISVITIYINQNKGKQYEIQ